jgi:hypothetical protein
MAGHLDVKEAELFVILTEFLSGGEVEQTELRVKVGSQGAEPGRPYIRLYNLGHVAERLVRPNIIRWFVGEHETVYVRLTDKGLRLAAEMFLATKDYAKANEASQEKVPERGLPLRSDIPRGGQDMRSAYSPSPTSSRGNHRNVVAQSRSGLRTTDYTEALGVNAGSKFPRSAGAKFPTSRVWRSAMHVMGASVFRGAATTFGWRRRGDGCVRARVLRDQVGVVAQPIAGTLDLDDDRVVQQPIQQRGGDHGIAEDLTPFRKAAVRGQDHGALFVSGVDQLEEQVGAAAGDGQIPDLVDDEQRGAGIEADLFGQAPLSFSLGQRLDQFGEAAPVDTAACFHRGHADGRGEVAFPGAGRAKEVQHFGSLDELELGQRHDAVSIQ